MARVRPAADPRGAAPRTTGGTTPATGPSHDRHNNSHAGGASRDQHNNSHARGASRDQHNNTDARGASRDQHNNTHARRLPQPAEQHPRDDAAGGDVGQKPRMSASHGLRNVPAGS